MFYDEFIRRYLIEGIEFIVNNLRGVSHYFAFQTICSGIEFIGSFCDNEPFTLDTASRNRLRNSDTHTPQRGANRIRFENALDYLFQSHGREYKTIELWLLRNSLIHTFLPNSPLLLASTQTTHFRPEHHLQEMRTIDRNLSIPLTLNSTINVDNKRLLLIECFFEDFREACRYMCAQAILAPTERTFTNLDEAKLTVELVNHVPFGRNNSSIASGIV